jgi:pyruvate/2-oxoglutarate dehydrogenase complex dihydrolipoamide acyltransferase (E2) component
MDDLISKSKTISDLLLHLHKSSKLLADLNVQKAPEAYEEKKGQVKVKLDEMNAQIVQFREKEEAGKNRVEEDKSEEEAKAEKEKPDGGNQQESQHDAVQQRLQVLRQVIKQKRQEQQSIVTHVGHAARANPTTVALLRESWKRKGVEKKKAAGKVIKRNEKTKKQRKFAWYFQRGGFPWL